MGDDNLHFIKKWTLEMYNYPYAEVTNRKDGFINFEKAFDRHYLSVKGRVIIIILLNFSGIIV